MAEKRVSASESDGICASGQGAILFGDFVEQRYLPFIQQNKKSWKTDRGNLRLHILPYLGSYRLTDISSDVLTDWIHSLQLSGLAYSFCRRLLSVAKLVLNCAIRWDEIRIDTAFRDVCLPYKQEKSRQPMLLEAADIVQLLDILRRYDHLAPANAIRLMLLTGASKSEILYARWDGVDYESGMLATRQNFTGRTHLVPLNNEALKLVHKLPRRDDIPWLFYTARGKRLTDITYFWYQIWEEFGHPELRLQDLRHCFANFLFEMGASNKDLRMILGHYRPDAMLLAREQAYGKLGQDADLKIRSGRKKKSRKIVAQDCVYANAK